RWRVAGDDQRATPARRERLVERVPQPLAEVGALLLSTPEALRGRIVALGPPHRALGRRGAPQRLERVGGDGAIELRGQRQRERGGEPGLHLARDRRAREHEQAAHGANVAGVMPIAESAGTAARIPAAPALI